MPSSDRASMERHAAYLGLTGLFLSILTAFALRQQRRGQQMELKLLEVIQLALATYRLGRLVAYDKVLETERLMFTSTVPDPTGAGETVVPRGEGARRAIGELISCPICAGTWISAALLYGMNIAPIPTRILINIMSAIGAAELLNAATEALQWTGEAARKQAAW